MGVPMKNLIGIEGQICGVTVLLAMDGDRIDSVDVDSIDSAVYDNAALTAYLDNKKFVGTVVVDGLPRTTYLIKLGLFFRFCQLNPSSQLDAFRTALERMTRSVQERGSYIDPSAGPAAHIPPGLEGNKTVQILALMMHQEVRLDQQERRQLAIEGIVSEVRGEIADVRQELGRGPSGWAIVIWLRACGIRADQELVRQEGLNVRKICLARGFLIGEEKVCNGGQHPARIWPWEAIEIWWPEFCRRMNRPVVWPKFCPRGSNGHA